MDDCLQLDVDNKNLLFSEISPKLIKERNLFVNHLHCGQHFGIIQLFVTEIPNKISMFPIVRDCLNKWYQVKTLNFLVAWDKLGSFFSLPVALLSISTFYILNYIGKWIKYLWEMSWGGSRKGEGGPQRRTDQKLRQIKRKSVCDSFTAWLQG